MNMRQFTLRALIACALLFVAAPMIAQQRGATPDRAMQRASVARTLHALRMTRGADAPTARQVTSEASKNGHGRLLGSGGSIAGTVTMPGTTRDIATVVAVNSDSIDEAFYAVDAQRDGAYMIGNLPAGRYYVFAQSSLCTPEFYDNVSTPDSATLVSVRDGGTTSGIDFSLEAIPVGEGSITGTVLSEIGGAGIEGATVWAMSLDNPSASGWAIADASGGFTISGLFSGNYVLQASAAGYVAEFYDNAATADLATPVSVSEPGTTSGVNFSLSPGATITGRVVDENGSPLAGAMIDAITGSRGGDSSAPTPGYGYAVTDDNGEYEITGLAGGDYIVSASYWGTWIGVQEYYDDAQSIDDATPVHATVNQTTSGIDFELSIPSFDGVMRGVVRDTAGHPIEGAFVMLLSGNDVMPVRAGASTTADGSYVIEGLPDGAYQVSAMAQSGWESVSRWWRDAETPEEADVVTITDGTCDVASVDFSLPLDRGTASISGTVRLADGTPISGAMVGVLVIDPSDSTMLFGTNAVTDDNGAYTIPYLPDGSYLVYASHWDDELMGMEWYLHATDPSSATPVVLADDEARTGVDFSLTMASWRGTISGRVTDDRTGAPVDHAYVEISPASITPVQSDIAYRPSYAVTDADGRYTIEGVPMGEYFVAAIGHGAYEYFDNAAHPDSATTVTVVGGGTTTVDFGLTARSLGDGSIAGRIYSEDSRPLDVGLVVAFPTNGTEETAFPTVAERDGSYSIPGLADGTYYVYAFSPEYIGEFYENAWDVSTATAVTVRNGGVTGGIDFGLDPSRCFPDDGEGSPGSVNGGIVYGTVTDNDGATIADANVYVVDDNRMAVASVRTKADGSYEIPGLPLGREYRVMASSVGYASEYNGDARSYDDAAPKQVRQGRMEVNFSLSRLTSGVGDVDGRTSGIAIAGSFPNPFATTTSIRFSLEKPMSVSVSVVDGRGDVVARLHDGILAGGAHELVWNGRSSDGTELGSGVYFVRIASGDVVRTTTVTLAR